jgi:hypothetical protein
MLNLKFVFLVLVLACIAAGCSGYHTESEVRAKIDSSIPVGSSKHDVIQFLESNGFQYIDEEKLPSPSDKRDYEWLPSSLETWGPLGKRYITIDFFFDRQNKSLVEYRINSFYSTYKST